MDGVDGSVDSGGNVTPQGYNPDTGETFPYMPSSAAEVKTVSIKVDVCASGGSGGYLDHTTVTEAGGTPSSSGIDKSGTLVAWNYAQEYGTTGEGLQSTMRNIEDIVDAVSNRVGGRDATVTYTTNGEHSPNSRHYSGDAIDLRNRDLTPQQQRQMINELRQDLGPNYRVINEEDHIHIQTNEPRQQNNAE